LQVALTPFFYVSSLRVFYTENPDSSMNLYLAELKSYVIS